MNTRNNIKITFNTPKYVIYGAQTKCFLTFKVKLPPILEHIVQTLIDKKYIAPMPKSVKGYATVYNKDEYDEQKGLKISMAKAEIAAYTAVNNWIGSVVDILIEQGLYKVDDFLLKSHKILDHDYVYIGKF